MKLINTKLILVCICLMIQIPSSIESYCVDKAKDYLTKINKEDLQLWNKAVQMNACKQLFPNLNIGHLKEAQEFNDRQKKGISCAKTGRMIFYLYSGKQPEEGIMWNLSRDPNVSKEFIISEFNDNKNKIIMFNMETQHIFSVLIFNDKVYLIQASQGTYNLHQMLDDNLFWGKTRQQWKDLMTNYYKGGKDTNDVIREIFQVSVDQVKQPPLRYIDAEAKPWLATTKTVYEIPNDNHCKTRFEDTYPKFKTKIVTTSNADEKIIEDNVIDNMKKAVNEQIVAQFRSKSKKSMSEDFSWSEFEGEDASDLEDIGDEYEDGLEGMQEYLDSLEPDKEIDTNKVHMFRDRKLRFKRKNKLRRKNRIHRRLKKSS